MKLLINGAEGQLASELKALSPSFPQIEFKFYNKNEWNLQDTKRSEEIICNENANALINLAAYTKVDLAEEERELCFDINAYKPEFIANLCKEQNTRFIYLSTDYVFFINQHKPIAPDSAKYPKGVYSSSKSLGEDLVLEANPDSIILRTSWLYSSYGHNFVKTMIKLGLANKELSIVDDQFGSPCYARDLAYALVNILNYPYSSHNANPCGYFHYSNEGTTNWLGFAKEIFNYLKMDVALRGISTEAFGSVAPRPAYSVLDYAKTINTFGLTVRTWQESLHDCLDLIKSNQLR